MIDLHCHILPGIDDGAENLEASIAMAEKAIQQGITHILCTPHHNNGKYSNEKSQVISLVASLQAELEKRQLPLTFDVIGRTRSTYYRNAHRRHPPR